MNYYFIKAQCTPYYCNPIDYNIVISEEISSFILKNKNKDTNVKFILDFYKEITESEYLKMKKLNPTNEEYILLSKNDYSKFHK